MATADHVKALVQSHAAGDEERFYAVAMQVAAQAARQGHVRFARDLRTLVDEAKSRWSVAESGQQTRPIPIVQPRGELAGLLSAEFPKLRMSDMDLDLAVRSKIDRVLLEQRQRARLLGHGMSPLRKTLLVGPPGTGKTMTAKALAGELSVPLFTIQLDGLITRYLGETAAKLRLVFDAVQSSRAVYLFDEFDALGGDRTVRNEVGEIRRILNSFLQFLENDESDSIIIAATNHPSLLDVALFRRFDQLIKYSLPSDATTRKLICRSLRLLGALRVDWREVLAAAAGLSHSDVARACEQALKESILDERTFVDTARLVDALNVRQTLYR